MATSSDSRLAPTLLRSDQVCDSSDPDDQLQQVTLRVSAGTERGEHRAHGTRLLGELRLQQRQLCVPTPDQTGEQMAPVAEPVSLLVHTFGTGKIAEDRLAEIVRANFDCRPGALVRELNLLRPIYQKTAAYGHFGRNEPEFTWEKTNKADALKSAAKKYFAAGGLDTKIAKIAKRGAATAEA